MNASEKKIMEMDEVMEMTIDEGAYKLIDLAKELSCSDQATAFAMLTLAAAGLLADQDRMTFLAMCAKTVENYNPSSN